LITGPIAVIAGCLTAYYERYPGHVTPFIIAVTIGGAMQVISQIAGFIYIKQYQLTGKKSYLNEHIGWMTGVFYGGCLIPAFLRLPEMFGKRWQPWSYFAFVFPLIMLIFARRAVQKKSFI
jgi:hypothetical protein